MVCVLLAGMMINLSALAQDPIDEFRDAYQNQDYVRAFNLLARLKRVSKNPAVFGKLMGLTAFRMEAYLYAMYLFEEYYRKVQKDAELLGNLMAAARKVMLEPYAAQTYYENIIAYDIMPNYVRAALAPEVVLEALERDDLGRVHDFLPYLRASRKGLYVGGVFASLNGTPDQAIKYFDRVVGLDVRHPKDYHIHLLAQLGLGRVYYEVKDWDNSIAHYNRIPRSSKLWFDALMESSWAHYQNGELNLALGKLHSFISPFLLNRLHPESLVLRTTVLFELCKYAEMATTLEFFYQVYRPMAAQLSSVLQAFHNIPDLRMAARKLLMGEGSWGVLERLPDPIRLHFVHHHKTYEYQERLAFIKDNADESIALTYRLGASGNREASNLERYIDNLKAFVLADYANWMQREMQNLSETIQRSLDEAGLVEIEKTLGEQEAIERIEDIIRQARNSGRILAIAGPGHEFWPFYNEFWKDETGYYIVNTPSSCITVP